MAIILGIDPGSRVTGFGLIDTQNNTPRAIDYGCIRMPTGELTERLHIIFTRLSTLIKDHQPHDIAIEQVFVSVNAQSALILGQARGAALTAVSQAGYPCHEYAARQVKQAVAGHGQANKQHIQHMIKMLLKLPRAPASDAADALAIALCHHHHATHQRRLDTAKPAAGAGS